MKRLLIFMYGIASYAMFNLVLVYMVAFFGNFWTPVSLDSEPRSEWWVAVPINIGLILLFAIQHSLMARPFFKRWLTRWIPESAERSTYVLVSNLAMIGIFLGWQPVGFPLWEVTHPVGMSVIYGGYFLGWAVLFASTLMINHFDLFGLRQVWLQFQGKPYTPLQFKTPGFYRYVRHPLYVGWLMIIWFTPVMSISHLLFSVATTAYILIAIVWEERDLEASLGMDYTRYKNEVPKLVPNFSRQRHVAADSGIQKV